MNNISFDLETLGNSSKAPIVQIGAVKFENNGTILDTFSRTIDLESLERYDLDVDYSTFLWWLDQDKEVINQVFGNYKIKSDLRNALEDFLEWVGNEDYNIWSHATFDPPVLKENINAVGLKSTIHYRSFKDLRTLKELAKNPKVKREGTHHIALDDALFQKDLIVACFKVLDYV